MRMAISWDSLITAHEAELRQACGLFDGRSESEVWNATREDALCGLPCLVCGVRGRFAKVVLASFSFQKIFGFKQEELLGQDARLVCAGARWLNQVLNGKEWQSVSALHEAVAQNESTSLVGRRALALLVSPTKAGKLFWTLAYVFHGVFNGQSYIFHVLKPVEAVVPQELWRPAEDGSHHLAMSHDVVEALLNKTRAPVHQWTPECSLSELAKDVLEACKKMVQTLEEAYMGDNFMPRLGDGAVKIFNENTGEKLLDDMEIELRSTWEAEDAGYQFPNDEVKVICCYAADPAEVDCPIVGVSSSFEALTGFTKDFALGRNSRFLLPRSKRRNAAFNDSELERLSDLIKQKNGDESQSTGILMLLLNENPSGIPFWSLTLFKHAPISTVHGKRNYVLAVQMNVVVQADVLNEFMPWEGTDRSAVLLERLRAILHTKEPSFAFAKTSLLSLSNQVISEWILEVGYNFKSCYMGGTYVPRAGQAAAQRFCGQWPSVFQATKAAIKKFHTADEETLHATLHDLDGGLPLTVSDPSECDIPIVYMSCAFEEHIGYRRDFALGRNCRFLQPWELELNEALNGPELKRIKAFCVEEQKNGESYTGLLLNEKASGDRFWNLLHLTHAHVGGRRFIVGIQTVIDSPMPALLWSREVTSNYEGSVAHILLRLSELTNELQSATLEVGCYGMHTAIDRIQAELKRFLLKSSDDYAGHQWVPQIGIKAVKEFQRNYAETQFFEEAKGKMGQLLSGIYSDVKEIPLVVSDLGSLDYPLVYVSASFEVFTGYSRDWSLGRNFRFLCPKDMRHHDRFNTAEVSKVSILSPMSADRSSNNHSCQYAENPQRVALILVSERRDRYPFLNCMILEPLAVSGRCYVVGALIDLSCRGGALAEVLAGDPEALTQLASLRSYVAECESQIWEQGFHTVIERCVSDWELSLPLVLQPPRVAIQGSIKFLPLVGVEVTQDTPIEVFMTSLMNGVRHFHLTFLEESNVFDPKRNEMGWRLLALRLAYSLALLREQKAHYLRASLVFTMRTPPHLVGAFAEVQKALKSEGYAVSVWVLDINNAPRPAVLDALTTMSQAVTCGEVSSVGVYGRNPTLMSPVTSWSGPVKVAFYALELFPGREFDHVENRILGQIRQSGAALASYNLIGSHRSWSQSHGIRQKAEHLNLDVPTMLLKWAESQGYAVLVPVGTMSALMKSKLPTDNAEGAHDKNASAEEAPLPHVHRDFVRAYCAAPSAEHCLSVLDPESSGGDVQPLLTHTSLSSRRTIGTVSDARPKSTFSRPRPQSSILPGGASGPLRTSGAFSPLCGDGALDSPHPVQKDALLRQSAAEKRPQSCEKRPQSCCQMRSWRQALMMVRTDKDAFSQTMPSRPSSVLAAASGTLAHDSSKPNDQSRPLSPGLSTLTPLPPNSPECVALLLGHRRPASVRGCVSGGVGGLSSHHEVGRVASRMSDTSLPPLVATAPAAILRQFTPMTPSLRSQLSGDALENQNLDGTARPSTSPRMMASAEPEDSFRRAVSSEDSCPPPPLSPGRSKVARNAALEAVLRRKDARAPGKWGITNPQPEPLPWTPAPPSGRPSRGGGRRSRLGETGRRSAGVSVELLVEAAVSLDSNSPAPTKTARDGSNPPNSESASSGIDS